MFQTPIRLCWSFKFAAALTAAVLILARCVSNDNGTVQQTHSQKGYAGSEACASCHADAYKSHLQTAHFRTSAPANDSTILGSFHPDSNSFYYNDHLRVAMEKRAKGAYQVAYQQGAEKLARRMDIVIGSGVMGQSFLSWRGQHLFQLPITYFSAAHTWSNSPGFPPKAVFNRIITSRCLECHASSVQTLSPPEKEPESFERTNIIFGVNCERCHGPAAQHVAFQAQNPKVKEARYIINPSKLSRQQSLDLCALCHGGRLQKTAPSFSFTAGNNLSAHFIIDTTVPDPQKIDVHGNQYGLLRASACFIKSKTLTCNTCHNTHKVERGDVALFSQRCMNCHQQNSTHFCKLKNVSLKTLTANCIDCHMPLQPSRAIAVFLPGKTAPTSASIRSHLIAVYEGTSKQQAALGTISTRK